MPPSSEHLGRAEISLNEVLKEHAEHEVERHHRQQDQPVGVGDLGEFVEVLAPLIKIDQFVCVVKDDKD